MLSFVIQLLSAIILAVIIFGFFRTWQTQHHKNQKVFLGGIVPHPMPDGPYKGNIGRHKVSWVGKKFDARISSGINVFVGKNGTLMEKYSFTTSVGRGLLDRNINVLKIDYNDANNPWWTRIILDEVVKISENTYLGKIIIRIIPGYPFAIGYFNLVK